MIKMSFILQTVPHIPSSSYGLEGDKDILFHMHRILYTRKPLLPVNHNGLLPSPQGHNG